MKSESSKELSSRPVFIQDDVIPYSAYQAIFYKLTKKTDRIFRSFKGGYTLNTTDIVNLDTMMAQAIVQYKVAGVHRSVVHSLKNGGSNTYNTMQLFRIADMNSRDMSGTVAYEIEFVVVLPGEIEEAKDIAQRYKITIVINRDEIDDQEENVPYFFRGFIGAPEIRFSLEYSDYIVAQALQTVVERWVGGLPKQLENKYIKHANKIEHKFRATFPSLMCSMPILGGAMNIYKHNYTINYSISLVMFCIFVSILFRASADILTDSIYKRVAFLGPRMFINFTLGDADHINSVKNKKKKLHNILSFIIVTVIFGTIISLFSSWVYTKIF